jgi:hypothetical protein
LPQALKYAQDQQGFQPHLYLIYDCAYGVIFFGTPYRGTSIASFGQLAARIAELSVNPSENHLLKALEQGSPELERIADSFSRMLSKTSKGMSVYSFQELLPVLSAGFVGKVGCHISTQLLSC